MQTENLLSRISVNPKVIVGKPTIQGSRVTVERILRAYSAVVPVVTDKVGLKAQKAPRVRQDSRGFAGHGLQAISQRVGNHYLPMVWGLGQRVGTNRGLCCLGPCLPISTLTPGTFFADDHFGLGLDVLLILGGKIREYFPKISCHGWPPLFCSGAVGIVHLLVEQGSDRTAFGQPLSCRRPQARSPRAADRRRMRSSRLRSSNQSAVLSCSGRLTLERIHPRPTKRRAKLFQRDRVRHDRLPQLLGHHPELFIELFTEYDRPRHGQYSTRKSGGSRPLFRESDLHQIAPRPALT